MVRPGGTEVIGTLAASEDLADLTESLNDFCCGREVMGGACSCWTRLDARLAAEAALLTDEAEDLMGAEDVPRPPSLSSTVLRLFLLTVCIPCAGAAGLDPPEDSWTGLRLDMTGPGGRDITLEAFGAEFEAGRVCWAIT